MPDIGATALWWADRIGCVFRRARRLMGAVWDHPVGRRRPLRTVGRIIRWQVRSRVRAGPHERPWIGGAVLVMEHGMTGATGNEYFGLHEFADMAFVAHVLRPGDVLLDIGANVGSYTVLGAVVCGADVIAFEPHPQTAERLRRNVSANHIEGRVEVHATALGEVRGTAHLTAHDDSTNRIVDHADGAVIAVPVERLDDILGGREPTMAKIDVEGHEAYVLAGAAATLAAPRLLAIEIETVTPAIESVLASAGFARRHYDPVRRALVGAPVSRVPANNHLFVRVAALDSVAQRVREAPPIEVLGWRL